jgi:hypothetical protein
LVEQRQTTSDHSTFSPRQTISRSDLCDNQSVQSLTPSPTPEALRLIDRLSDPDPIHPLSSQSLTSTRRERTEQMIAEAHQTYQTTMNTVLDRFSAEHPFHYVAPVLDNSTPLVSFSPSSVPLCAICSLIERYEHHTPDCVHYVCFICEVSLMSLLNSSPCIFANSMSDTIEDTEEVNNATYLVHYYS